MFSAENIEALKELNKDIVVAPASTEQAPIETPNDGVETDENQANTSSQEEEPYPNAEPENSTTEPNSPEQVHESPEIPEAILARMKEHGYDSLEQLLEAANKKAESPAKELSEEEKAQAENEARVAFEAHAVKNLRLTPDYLRKVENLQAQPAKDVVYNAFKADYLAANKEADDDDVTFAFNNQFSIDSEDEGLKAHGQKMLDLYKEKIVQEQSSEYNKAKLDFETLQKLQAEEPVFKAGVLKVIEDSIEESIEIGAGEEKTNYKSTVKRDDVFKYIEKQLGTEFMYDMFSRHLDGQSEQISNTFKTLTGLVQKAMVFEDAARVHGHKMKSLGLNEGALGSKAPFVKDTNMAQPALIQGDLSMLSEVFAN